MHKYCICCVDYCGCIRAINSLRSLILDNPRNLNIIYRLKLCASLCISIQNCLRFLIGFEMRVAAAACTFIFAIFCHRAVLFDSIYIFLCQFLSSITLYTFLLNLVRRPHIFQLYNAGFQFCHFLFDFGGLYCFVRVGNGGFRDSRLAAFVVDPYNIRLHILALVLLFLFLIHLCEFLLLLNFDLYACGFILLRFCLN